MTTFMASSGSVDEATSVLRPRQQALFMAAEDAIPGSSDKVVHAVQECRREDACQARHLPRPPELAGDEERGVALREEPSSRRPVVRQNVERGQLVRVTSAALHHRFSRCTLERSEIENGAVIVLEEELQKAAAKPADAVVENQVSALRLLGGVMG